MKSYFRPAALVVAMIILSAILNLAAANLVTLSSLPALSAKNQVDGADIVLNSTPLTWEARHVVFTGEIDAEYWQAHWDDILFRIGFKPGYTFTDYTIITNSTMKSDTHFETRTLKFTGDGAKAEIPGLIRETIAWPTLDPPEAEAKLTRTFELVMKIKKIVPGLDPWGIRIHDTSYIRLNKDAKIKQKFDAAAEYPFAKSIGKLQTTFKKIEKKENTDGTPFELSFKLSAPVLPRDSKNDIVFLDRFNSTVFETDSAIDTKGLATIQCTLNSASIDVVLDVTQNHLVLKVEDAAKVAEKKDLVVKCPGKQLRVFHAENTQTFYAVEVLANDGIVYSAVDGKESRKPSKQLLGLIALVGLVIIAALVVILLKVFKLACFSPKSEDSTSLLGNSKLNN